MNKRYKSVITACVLTIIFGIYICANRAVFTDFYSLFSSELNYNGDIAKSARDVVSGKVELNTISYITEDDNRNIYVVSNYGQNIFKADNEGKILFTLTMKQSNKRAYYNSIAVDKTGSMYLLNTILDSNGLYVVGEEIDKYSPQGKFEKTIYKVRHENDNKPMRVGRIKELTADDNYLYFNYVLNNGAVDFRRIKIGTNELDTFNTLKFTEDKYINDIIRTDNGNILYSTKNGQIYKVYDSGQPSLVYSSSLSSKGLSLLSHFKYYDNNLYFIDMYKPGIMKTDINNLNEPSEYIKSLHTYNITSSEESNELQNLFVTKDGRIITFTDNKLFFVNTDGSIYKSIAALKIPDSILLWFFIFCLALLLFVVVVIDLLRVIYVHFMGRKVPLILKEIIIFIPTVILITFFLIYRINYRTNNEIGNEMKNKLNIIALTASKFVDGDRLEKINGPEDFMSEDHKYAVKNVVQVYTSNEDSPNKGLYNTLYKIDGGKEYFIMDDDDARLFFEPVDTGIPNYKEMYEQVVDKGKTYYGTAERDNTGEWINVMAPIYNSKGTVVGIYETGMDYTSFVFNEKDRLIKNLRDVMLASVIIILAFFIITFYMLSAIKKLKRGVDEIAAGNWNAVVSVKSNDEISNLCEGFNTMAKYIRTSISEMMKMNEAYYYFVPQQFLKLLEKDNIYEVKLGDSMKKDMSIMYSSIRPFQKLLQNNTSEENFNFINSYLSSFGPIIRDNNGIVERYLGMDILALFPQNADDGLNAAIRMSKELVSYNEERIKDRQIPIEIGIGIYHGPLMLGIIGEEKRLEGTVISDEGNTSEVLARLTEGLSSQIIITENTLKGLNNASCYKYRSLGYIVLQGKNEKIFIYDVYDADLDSIKELKDNTKKTFEEGIRLYQEKHFFESRAKFVEVIKQNDSDRAAKVYFFLSDDYSRNGVPDNWDGRLNIFDREKRG